MIEFSLYENAFDSLEHGLEHLESAVKQNNRCDYKQAILLFSQSVELFLKQLLSQINPMLVFDKNSLYSKCEDWNNPKLEELYSCKSIEISPLCNEVIKYYPLVYQKGSMKSFECLIKERNKLQHFSINVDENEIRGLILRVYHDVISPAIKVIVESVSSKKYDKTINEHLAKIFCTFEMTDKEEQVLILEKTDYTRGCCFKCGNHSLFIIYAGNSYPIEFYCSSCIYKRSNIYADEYLSCPECGAASLIYDEELEGGICLWHRCANHNDGGVLIEMDYCTICNNYKIEGVCECNDSQDK